MKEKVPAQWYILRTPMNYEEINKWFNETYNKNYTSKNSHLYHPAGYYKDLDAYKKAGYVEIDINYFRLHIAKTTPVINNSYPIFY